MNAIEFINAIKKIVRDSAINGTIENLISPPGRKPPEMLIKLSQFYNQLSEEQKININEIIKDTSDFTIFNFLCVIDGASVIEDGGEGEILLVYRKKGKDIILNNSISLHDIYNDKE